MPEEYRFDRCVDEFLDAGKVDNRVELCAQSRARAIPMIRRPCR